MTKLWTIRPICVGEFPVMEKSSFTYYNNQGVKFSAAAIVWLLRSGDETILVDTGPGDPATVHPSHTQPRRTPDQEPGAALRAAGVIPETLKVVVLTHLHWDHCYNLELFPQARFLVQADELKAAVDPVLPQRTIYEFGLPGVRPPWMTVLDRLQMVRGDADLVEGIRLVHLPGHTPGLQGVLVDTAKGPHLVASDAVNLYDNLGDGGPNPILPGIHTDVVACERTMERIRSMGAVVLPSHDWEVLKQPVHPAAE